MTVLKTLLKLLFLFPFLAIGVTLFFTGIHEVISAQESVHWPTTTGQITASSIRERRSRPRRRNPERISYDAQVQYQFSVGRQRFKGDRIAYGDHGSGDRGHAQRTIRRYPRGKTVTVYYRPGQPKDALLEPGLQTQAWYMPGFGLLFAGAGLWAMVSVVTERT